MPTAEAEAHWRAIPARLCRLPRITSWKSPRDLSAQAPDPNAVPTAEDEAYRRAILARSRNYLLFEALRDEGWVLWLDVDIVAVCSNCNFSNVLYRTMYRTGSQSSMRWETRAGCCGWASTF